MGEVWMVRAGRDSVYIDDFLEQGLVAIGWNELGPVEEKESKSQILKHYSAVYPEHSDGQAQVGVSQVLRFLKEVEVGDTVITYDRDRRMYYLGEILSPVMWSPDRIPGMPRIREVLVTQGIT